MAMTLKDCTKEELIFVIKRLQFYNLNSGHCILRALNDVERRREERKYDDARRLLEFSRQKTEEYVDLLSPYDGKPVVNIPPGVMKQAAAAMQEVRAAELEWCRLMGIHGVKPGPTEKEEKS